MDKIFWLLGLLSITAGGLMIMDHLTGGDTVMAISGFGALASGVSLLGLAAVIALLREIRDNTRK